MQDGDPLHIAFAAGRAAWPRAELSPAGFAGFVQRNGVQLNALKARPGDIFLAAACQAGDRAALSYFERFFVAAVPRHVARFSLSPEQVQEVQQQTRVRLLAGPQPRIGSYAAKAPLDAWIRMVAIRLALDMLRSATENETSHANDAVHDAGSTAPDLDATLVRQRLAPDLQQALNDSLKDLSSRERSVLRMHFVDGLNIEEIGRVYGVHRATVARWLLALRSQLFGALKSKLSLPRTPSSSEFRSLVRVVRDDLHVSLNLLRSAEP